ncbi:MAG: hypothetical protein WCK17_03330 [Verrucomicrobiota bacterium]
MIKGQIGGWLSNLGGLGVLGANPFRGGEENRAKDAKVGGMKDDEIGRVVVEGAFALRIQMPSESGMCQIGRVVVEHTHR